MFIDAITSQTVLAELFEVMQGLFVRHVMPLNTIATYLIILILLEQWDNQISTNKQYLLCVCFVCLGAHYAEWNIAKLCW